MNKTGRLVERYEYTPYGERTVYSKGWLVYDLNGDGRVNTNDLVYYEPGVLAQIASPDSFVDVTGDGECDADDRTAVSNAIGTTVSYGNDALVMNPTLGSHRSPGGTTGADGVALCAFGHQGLYHDEATGLVYNRARMLAPRHGRYMQRDPYEYVDGLNLYEALRTSPLYYTDPYGEETSEIRMPASGWSRSGVRLASTPFVLLSVDYNVDCEKVHIAINSVKVINKAEIQKKLLTMATGRWATTQGRIPRGEYNIGDIHVDRRRERFKQFNSVDIHVIGVRKWWPCGRKDCARPQLGFTARAKWNGIGEQILFTSEFKQISKHKQGWVARDPGKPKEVNFSRWTKLKEPYIPNAGQCMKTCITLPEGAKIENKFHELSGKTVTVTVPPKRDSK